MRLERFGCDQYSTSFGGSCALAKGPFEDIDDEVDEVELDRFGKGNGAVIAAALAPGQRGGGGLTLAHGWLRINERKTDGTEQKKKDAARPGATSLSGMTSKTPVIQWFHYTPERLFLSRDFSCIIRTFVLK
jgi:hypothetical protein